VTVFDEMPDDVLFKRLSREFQDTLGQAGPAQGREATVFEIVAGA
jgi:hypothetical protein